MKLGVYLHGFVGDPVAASARRNRSDCVGYHRGLAGRHARPRGAVDFSLRDSV